MEQKNKIEIVTVSCLFGKSQPACMRGGRGREERQSLMPNMYFAMSWSIILLLFVEMPWTEQNGPEMVHHSQTFDESGFGFWFMIQHAGGDEFSRWDTGSTPKTNLLLSAFQCCPRHWLKEKHRSGLLPKLATQISLITARDIDPCTIHLHGIVANRKNLCHTHALSFVL